MSLPAALLPPALLLLPRGRLLLGALWLLSRLGTVCLLLLLLRPLLLSLLGPLLRWLLRGLPVPLLRLTLRLLPVLCLLLVLLLLLWLLGPLLRLLSRLPMLLLLPVLLLLLLLWLLSPLLRLLSGLPMLLLLPVLLLLLLLWLLGPLLLRLSRLGMLLLRLPLLLLLLLLVCRLLLRLRVLLLCRLLLPGLRLPAFFLLVVLLCVHRVKRREKQKQAGGTGCSNEFTGSGHGRVLLILGFLDDDFHRLSGRNFVTFRYGHNHVPWCPLGRLVRGAEVGGGLRGGRDIPAAGVFQGFFRAVRPLRTVAVDREENAAAPDSAGVALGHVFGHRQTRQESHDPT